jgi:Na+-transporting NADH:ubiquinone oxidoreductase subunit NqrD
VIGAVLRSRQGAALSQGVRPAEAFLDGYHAGLALTIVLVLAGVVISYLALRRLPAPATTLEPVAVDGVAAGPELASRS